jgi:hypothetical protein
MESTFDKTIPHEDCSSRKHCQSDCTDNRRRVYVKTAEPRQCRQARGTDVPKRKRPRAGPSQLSRTMSLRVMAREYVWLWDYRHGLNAQAIAIRDGVKVQRVEFGIARAQAQDKPGDSSTALRPPRLIPFFPIGPYTPLSSCGHHRPIEQGSFLCCMVCHRSGVDDHPALERDPRTEPAPEPKPAPAPMKPKCETRKQRRQRIFAVQA